MGIGSMVDATYTMDHRVSRFATRGQCIKGKKLDCFQNNHVFCFKLECASIVVLLCTAIWWKSKDAVVHSPNRSWFTNLMSWHSLGHVCPVWSYLNRSFSLFLPNFPICPSHLSLSLSLSLSNVLSLSRQYFETFFSSFVNFPKISKFEQNVCYGLTDGIRNSFLGLKFYENISNSSSDSLSYLFLLRCFFRFHSRKKCLAHSKKKVLSLSSSSQCHATTLVWAS